MTIGGEVEKSKVMRSKVNKTKSNSKLDYKVLDIRDTGFLYTVDPLLIDPHGTRPESEPKRSVIADTY
jgi:hypothetical protein